MSAIDDARTVIEILAGRTLNNTVLIRAVKNYMVYDETLGWTNEELAANFLANLKKRVKHQIKAGAANLMIIANQAAIAQAADDAGADI